MSDRFNVPNNASVYNLKQTLNGLANGLNVQDFTNRIFNPTMRDRRGGSVFAWESSIVLETPVDFSDTYKFVKYTLAPGE